MNTVMQNYDPLVSEFQSPEQEQSHDAWLQAKVKSSLLKVPNLTEAAVSKDSQIGYHHDG